VHLVTLLEQEFGEVGAVLARDAGDEGAFGHSLAILGGVLSTSFLMIDRRN
jgi:hypothetical protein